MNIGNKRKLLLSLLFIVDRNWPDSCHIMYLIHNEWLISYFNFLSFNLKLVSLFELISFIQWCYVTFFFNLLLFYIKLFIFFFFCITFSSKYINIIKSVIFFTVVNFVYFSCYLSWIQINLEHVSSSSDIMKSEVIKL